MKSTSITTDNFHLSLLGNGATLTLFNRTTQKDIFMQGDDAAQLLDEIEIQSAAGRSYDEILGEIFHQHSEV